MQIEKSTVLITGANRGIGLAFAKAFLARGAKKVYAGTRDTSKISLAGVTPIKLDVNQSLMFKTPHSWLRTSRSL